ncbi:hypothetical protein [Herbiconiux sp.]|uniref:hypothetical protein n=1 Tax=Herbiconiux sp. TaxID=1871186 RepID=UPI0025BA7E92|nr:hypothetical protein [Herbiconiux sp.]
MSLPLDPAAGFQDSEANIAVVKLRDSSASGFGHVAAVGHLTDDKRIRLGYLVSDGTYARWGVIDSTTPFTWAAGDKLSLSFACPVG